MAGFKNKVKKLAVKKGDKVLVIAGKDRHKVGEIRRVIPRKNLVIVTGVNLVKKHLKRTAKTPQGGIIDVEKPLHVSNVMLLDPKTNKPTRIAYKMSGQDKVRISKVSGEIIK